MWCIQAEGVCDPALVVPISEPACESRPLVSCEERQDFMLEPRLGRSCDYDSSYNPLEISIHNDCVFMLRARPNTHASRRETMDCLVRELSALRFDCTRPSTDSVVLLYRDTLATP